MNTKKFFILQLVSACFIYQNEAFPQTPTSKIEWYSLNMGFAIPVSANTTVKSAVGQAFVGGIQNANSHVESGFLAHPLLRGEDPTAVEDRRNDEIIPSIYALEQNYPNPFNPSTTIAFALPKPSEVTLKIYDAFGREVATLAEGKLPAGRHEVVFDASPFSSGVYFYRFQAGEFSQIRRLVFVK